MHGKKGAALCVFLLCVPGTALQQPSWTRPTGSTLHFRSGSSSATVRIPGFAQSILLPVHSAGATAPRARNALTRHAQARNALTWSELNNEAKNNELVRLSTRSRILRCRPREHNCLSLQNEHTARISTSDCRPARSCVHSHSKFFCRRESFADHFSYRTRIEVWAGVSSM
jgi:hypothetical protein